MEQQRARKVALALGICFFVFLFLGTCTPLLVGVLPALPSHADLLFHGVAHAALVITVALATNLPSSFIFAGSIALAVVVEGVQGAFVPGRVASGEDIVAGAVGSCAVLARQRLSQLVIRAPETEDDSGDEIPV